MSLKNAIGGVALIAGTAIGAAVLALPISTAHLGFFPTLLIYGVCWFFMLMGALYLLETNLFVGYGTNLFTMADKTLGKSGKYFTFAIYLILLYALTAAYLNGAGEWLYAALNYFHFPASRFACAILAAILTLIVIGLGTAITDWVNRFLMIGLISAFATLLCATFPQINWEQLHAPFLQWDLRPLPLIITAFGSAIVIPSLTDYLHGKPRQLFYVVIIGSVIPLMVYIIWEMAILGIIPLQGPNGLLQIQQSGHPVTDVPAALQTLLKNQWLTNASVYFSIFALLTSLLGVSLSLFDFLADGLRLPKNLKGKSLLAAITFIPPLSFIAFYPRGFAFALSFAGIFVALLLGILPAMMAWQGRYRLKLGHAFQVVGGKILMVLTTAFFLFVIGVECFNQYENFSR